MPDVTISMEEYLRLVEDSEFLSCLEQMGVDNWGGYEDACALKNGEYDGE